MSTRLPLGSFTAPHPADSAHSACDTPAIENWPPLSLLKHETRAIPALLLRSFADTHREAFEYQGFTIHQVDDLEVVAGDFMQRGTGHCYLVSVTPVLSESQQSGTPIHDELLQILADAERFISGFQESELQEGVGELLARMRRLLPATPVDASTIPE